MGTMTKSDLIEEVARRTGITRSRAELVVNRVFESMASALEQGEGIEVRGFGSFSIREYGSYKGRNPKTNDPVVVAPKKLPFFKVGKELREMVNARAGTPLPDDHDAPDETDLDESDPEESDEDGDE